MSIDHRTDGTVGRTRLTPAPPTGSYLGMPAFP